MPGLVYPNYARMIEGTEEPGFSRHLVSVHNKDEKDFKEVPQEGIDTVWKCFKMQVKAIPEREWLGSRDFKNYARGPYVWKTWKEINEIVECLAIGFQAYDLLPKVDNEG